MCGGSPKQDTSFQDEQRRQQRRARSQEEQRQARIEEGLGRIRSIFDGGGEYAGVAPVLDQRKAAMEGYYMPQLEQQFGDAKNNLTFALSRAGLLNSSAAGEKQADLVESYGLERGNVLANIARDQASTKSNINQQRSAIEAALRASGDQSAAADQALQSAATFSQDQPNLSPLGPLFFGISEAVGARQRGQQVAEIRRAATPAPLSGSGSARVVR